MCFVALAFYIDAQEIVREIFADRTSGTIVATETDRNHCSNLVRFTYKSPDGTVHQSQECVLLITYKSNDDVTILYWQSNVHDGVIAGTGFAVSGFVGLFSLFMTIVCRLAARPCVMDKLFRMSYHLFMKLP